MFIILILQAIVKMSQHQAAQGHNLTEAEKIKTYRRIHDAYANAIKMRNVPELPALCDLNELKCGVPGDPYYNARMTYLYQLPYRQML